MLSLYFITTTLYPIQSFVPIDIEKMTNIMSSRSNIFVYSNTATLLSSDLSNTGLENIIYCSTTTDAGPIQTFTSTSLSSGIPYYTKDIYQE